MSNSSYRVPYRNRVLRRIARPTFRGLFHLLSRVVIDGSENIPPSPPYVIAINHVSLFDPPFAIAFWPIAPEAVGAVDIWSRPGQSALARIYGGIPVHRGQYDRKLIDTMLNVLRSGRALLIAPEGGRSHAVGMRRGLPGIAYMVDAADVPVVPVGISGATDDFLEKGLRGKRPTIRMSIGTPFKPPPLEGRGKEMRAARQRNVDIVMLKIAALLPPEYWGVYEKGMPEDAAISADPPAIQQRI